MSMFKGIPSKINGKNNPEYARKYQMKYTHSKHGKALLKRRRLQQTEHMSPDEYADYVLASMRKDYDTPIYF